MHGNGSSQFQKRLTVPWEMSKAQGILSSKLSVIVLRGHLERVWEAVSVPVPQLISFYQTRPQAEKKAYVRVPRASNSSIAWESVRDAGSQVWHYTENQKVRGRPPEHLTVSLGGSTAVPVRSH